MIPTQDIRDLSSHFKKIWDDAKNLRKRNIELTGDVREKDARPTVESSTLTVVEKELTSVKEKLAVSRVESANF